VRNANEVGKREAKEINGVGDHRENTVVEVEIRVTKGVNEGFS